MIGTTISHYKIISKLGEGIKDSVRVAKSQSGKVVLLSGTVKADMSRRSLDG